MLERVGRMGYSHCHLSTAKCRYERTGGSETGSKEGLLFEHSNKKLLGAPGLATRSDRSLLGAPDLTTRSKDATRGSWSYYEEQGRY